MVSVPSKRLEQKFPDAKPIYTKGEAFMEASRCLYCHDAPCIAACPTEIDIPTFIKKIATGNLKGSAKTILDSNILGYSCGRVCPVEVLCAGACVYNDWDQPPIQIGRLQRYATEWLVASSDVRLYRRKPSTGKKIALVGAGPASLACAAHLAIEGHQAILFERNEFPGGLNTTGVAPYKLHVEDSIKEIQFILSLGVELKTGVEIGKDISTQELLQNFDAVFLGLGLGEDTKLGIVGEEGPGVMGAIEMIRRLKLDPMFELPPPKRVLVIGGGNTAIDAARELAQLGAKHVSMVYRRSRKEMSGYDHEWEGAQLDGVAFFENAVPLAIERIDGRIQSVKLTICKNGKPMAGFEKWVECDFVVVAIGQNKIHKLATAFEGVTCDEKGCVAVDRDTGRTSNPKVFSGGDCVNGGKEVVNAVAEGKKAALSIHRMLSNGAHG